MMNKYIAIALTGTLIVGCRPHDDGNDSSAGVSNEPEIGAALAVQQTESAIGTPFVGITVAELGELAEAPNTITNSIVASRDFSFTTSRKISVELDVVEARGMTTDVVICTDFTNLEHTYDVNYDSCLVRTQMYDGQLTSEIDIVNHHDKLLGVVWFPEEGTEPVYREFALN